MVEKFSSVSQLETAVGKVRPLRVIELEGNGRTGSNCVRLIPRQHRVLPFAFNISGLAIAGAAVLASQLVSTAGDTAATDKG